MRILMIGHEWFPDRLGGGGRYLAEVARGLAGRGHVVTVVVPRASDSLPPREAHDTLTLLRLDLGAGAAAWALGLARGLGAIVAGTGPFDVVHSHFAPIGLPALWHPALAGARRVTQFQGPWADESRLEGASRLSVLIRRRVERFAYGRSHRAIVLSEAFAGLLAARYGVPPARIDVVPAGGDLDRFTPAVDRAALRAQLGLSAGPQVFVARRLVARMGLPVLLEAWRAVAAVVPEARLAIAGEGPLRGELEAGIAAHGLAGSVALLGKLTDDALVARYQAADLAVMPTLALEGFGLATVEALACGTPVVGTDAGALPEVLRPLADDLIVPAGDAPALADRLIGALTGGRPLPPRAACRAHAALHYTWAAALDGVEASLRRA